MNAWSDYVIPSQWTTSTLHGGSIPNLVNPGDYSVIVESIGAGDATQFFSMLPSENKSSSHTGPVASFGYYGNRTTEPYNIAPLTVQFEDMSANSPTSWLWSFGDGNSSTSQNPSHTYMSAGTYTVTLTATNTAGSNTTSGSLSLSPGYESTQSLLVPPTTTPSASLPAALSLIVLMAIVIMSSIYRKKM